MRKLYFLGALVLWAAMARVVWLVYGAPPMTMATALMPWFGAYVGWVLICRFAVRREFTRLMSSYRKQYGPVPGLVDYEGPVGTGQQIGSAAEVLGGVGHGELIGAAVGLVVAEAKKAWVKRDMTKEQALLFDEIGGAAVMVSHLQLLTRAFGMLLWLGLTWVGVRVIHAL